MKSLLFFILIWVVYFLPWIIAYFSPRLSPGALIWFRNQFRKGKIDPASEAFYRSHPDTVQLYHRIISHRLRAPADYEGLPVLGTFLRDLRDVVEIPPQGARTDEELLGDALQRIRYTHKDLYSVVSNSVFIYLGIPIPVDDSEN